MWLESFAAPAGPKPAGSEHGQSEQAAIYIL